MGLQFGIFVHIEPVSGQTLTQIYRDRLDLLEHAMMRQDFMRTISLSIIRRRSTVWPRRRMSSSPPPHNTPDSYGWHRVSTSCRCITHCD